MKKFMPFIAAALFAASLFVSCANQSSDDSATNPSLASVLNSSSSSTVDLEGKSYTENVVLDKALTVKNATITGTVTVNVAGVTLENVSATKVIAGTGIGSGDFTLTNCSAIGSLEVNGGGSNSIHLNSCNIVLITVSKENVRIVPTGSMVIGSMAVSADNVMLDTSSSDVTVTTLTISADVKTILITGGTITTINVASSASNTPTITIDGTPVITDVKGTAADGTTSSTVTLVTTENASSFTKPAGVTLKAITTSSIELVKDKTAKTSYSVGDSFDYTGLSAKITHSDSTTRTVSLNSSNCTLSGFSTSAAGNETVSFTYKNTNVTGTLSITVTANSGYTKAHQLILDGITALKNKDYNTGISDFNNAYNAYQNDETRIFSALATLAGISTSSEVSDLVKNYAGIDNYPSTPNALLSNDWIESSKKSGTVTRTDHAHVATFIESATTDSYGYYRANGTTTAPNTFVRDAYSYYGQNIIPGVTGWVSSWDIEDYNYNIKSKSINYLFSSDYQGSWSSTHLYVTEFSNTGSYMVRCNKSSVPAGMTQYQISESKKVDYKYQSEYVSYSPEMNIPSWFTNSALCSEPQAVLLANILNNNSSGLNKMLDAVYSAVFSTSFTTIESRIDDISGTVTIPADVISALNLTDTLGDGDISVGKPELKLIVSALNLIKGTLEYLQSYNLNTELSFFKFNWNDEAACEATMKKYLTYDASIDPMVNGFMTVRDESKVASSKATFITVVNDLITAYDSIISNKSYPTAVSDKLDEYSILRKAAVALKASLTDGTTFYIPDSIDNLTEWPTTGTRGINMGNLFTAGEFKITNLIDKAGGKPMFLNFCYSRSGSNLLGTTVWNSCSSYSLFNSSEKILLSSSTLYFTSSSESSRKRCTKDEVVTLVNHVFDDTYNDNYYRISMRINLYNIESTFIGMNITSNIDGDAHINSLDSSKIDYKYCVPISSTAALYLYNFYNNGIITDALKANLGLTD